MSSSDLVWCDGHVVKKRRFCACGFGYGCGLQHAGCFEAKAFYSGIFGRRDVKFVVALPQIVAVWARVRGVPALAQQNRYVHSDREH